MNTDSYKPRKDYFYCRFLAVTVEKEEWVIPTAVLECFPAQIAVA